MKSEVTYMHPSTIDVFSTQLPEQTFGTGSSFVPDSFVAETTHEGNIREPRPLPLVYPPKNPALRDRWEYRTAYSLHIADLDQLGQEGWELCGIVSATTLSSATCFFKRKVL